MRKLLPLFFSFSIAITAQAQTFYGTPASDSTALGIERLTASNWTSVGWTGGFAAGWAHTTGNTTSLTNTYAATSGNYYQIAYTITGRTAGYISIQFGGVINYNISATGSLGVNSVSTGTLSISPTSDFNGTLTISLKLLAGANSASTTFSSSDSIPRIEFRASKAFANTFIGVNSGSRNTTGTANSLLGYDAGAKNMSGAENIFFGHQAGSLSVSGNANSFLGASAGKSNTTGNNNVFVGAYAGYENLGGLGNTFIGNNAGRGVTTGNFNTIIGAFVNGLSPTLSNHIIIADGSGNKRIFVNATGKIGINNLSPTESLDITGNLRFSGALMPNNIAGTTGQVLTSAGAGAVPTWGTISSGGTGWGLTGSAGTNTTTNFIGTTDNKGLAFRTKNTIKMLIDTIGSVGIGTAQIADTNYRLFVEKGIRTRKVKVDATVWADYVFDVDYSLPTLQEVDKFIQENKHLPGVLSTAEVEKNGLDLGENQAVLLKKIEELTLYMIAHERRMTELDKIVKELTIENDHLKLKINQPSK